VTSSKYNYQKEEKLLEMLEMMEMLALKATIFKAISRGTMLLNQKLC